MRAVNRFNVTHFWNPHVLRIPNWYGTCLVMKIFTIGLPAECDLTPTICICIMYVVDYVFSVIVYITIPDLVSVSVMEEEVKCWVNEMHF